MLNVGMWIRTSYGTGPYRIESIHRGCTCASYVNTINMEDPPASPPHIHLVVSEQGLRSPCYLNGYDEETLCSVWSKDRLFIVKDAFKQLELPF